MTIDKSGFNAVTKITKSMADILIIDVMMPGGDGFGIVKTVREYE